MDAAPARRESHIRENFLAVTTWRPGCGTSTQDLVTRTNRSAQAAYGSRPAGRGNTGLPRSRGLGTGPLAPRSASDGLRAVAQLDGLGHERRQGEVELLGEVVEGGSLGGVEARRSLTP